MRTRFNLSRHLRSRHIQVTHAFDFYTNLTLIPAAWFAHVPVIIGSHRQTRGLAVPCKIPLANDRFSLVRCSRVQFESRVDRLAAAGTPREKLVVVGNAVNVEAFDHALATLSAPAQAQSVSAWSPE